MKREKIPFGQYWATALGLLITTAYYTYPRAAVAAASSAAVWVVPLSGVAALLLLWPVAAALAARPGRDLIDLALAAGGRSWAIAATLLLSGTFLAYTGLTIRQVSEMVVTALYPHTPQTFAMVSLTIIGALGAMASPAGATWAISLYTWPALLSVMIVIVGNLGWGQFRNLMPLSGHGILPALGQVFPLSTYLSPLVHMAIFARYLKEPGRLPQGMLRATAFALPVWTAAVMVYLMVFPLPGSLEIPFPLFEMSRLVQGGRYFERIDALWLIFWTFGSACVLTGTLISSALLFQRSFRLPDHRLAVPPLAIAAVAIALFPSNQAKAISLQTTALGRWGFLVTLVLPCAIALVAQWRQRRHARGGAADA